MSKAVEKPLDFDKPLQTQDGSKVRIFVQDGGGRYPILGAFWSEIDQQWSQQCWTVDGRFATVFGCSSKDLIRVPETKSYEFWIVFWRDGSFSKFDTEPYRQNATAIKYFKGKYTDGDGLLSGVQLD